MRRTITPAILPLCASQWLVMHCRATWELRKTSGSRLLCSLHLIACPRHESGLRSGEIKTLRSYRKPIASPECRNEHDAPSCSGDFSFWHETDVPKYLGNVRYWVNSGKHLLAASISGFDPGCVKTSAHESAQNGFLYCLFPTTVASSFFFKLIEVETKFLFANS